MAEEYKLQRCHECKGEGLADVLEHVERTLAGVTFTDELPAQRCPHCGEVTFGAETLDAFERRLAYQVAQLGLCAPDAFKFLRKMLGMRAADLAKWLDVQPETISRWERGAVPIDKVAMAVLAALYAEHYRGEHEMMDRLAGRAAPSGPVKLSA